MERLEKGSGTSVELVTAALALRAACEQLQFGSPVTHVCNPLVYAWAAHKRYLSRYGKGHKRVLFLGMNPGPFGMAQTGIPFGEVSAVRDWLKIQTRIARPAQEHPRRPVLGFACARSEVSGRRLWGLFARRYSSAEAFFNEHFVVNYCPLVFFEDSGRNRTPDKLPATEGKPLFAACDAHLKRVIEILQPEWLVAVGRFAEQRAANLASLVQPRIACIPHPSPANPAANKFWEQTVTGQLEALQIWKDRPLISLSKVDDIPR